MPNFKRIGGGPWKNGKKSVDLTWNDPPVGERIEVFHTHDQNHMTAVGNSILEVKLCITYSGSGRYAVETGC